MSNTFQFRQPDTLRCDVDLSNGACRDYDTEMFFPGRGDMVGIKRAVEICRTCEVREACLEYAIASNEQYGIWGGLTGKQRRQLKRVRRAVANL